MFFTSGVLRADVLQASSVVFIPAVEHVPWMLAFCLLVATPRIFTVLSGIDLAEKRIETIGSGSCRPEEMSTR